MQAVLYRRALCLFVSAAHELAKSKSVTWSRGRCGSVCCLRVDARNSRIIDEGGCRQPQPSPRLETDSIMNLFSSVRTDGAGQYHAGIFPECAGADGRGQSRAVREPAVEHAVGLVAVNREPLSPLVAALFAAAKKMKAG